MKILTDNYGYQKNIILMSNNTPEAMNKQQGTVKKIKKVFKYAITGLQFVNKKNYKKPVMILEIKKPNKDHKYLVKYLRLTKCIEKGKRYHRENKKRSQTMFHGK